MRDGESTTFALESGVLEPFSPSPCSDAPKALDLFCGAGGASMGIHRAGFEVTGMDIERV